MNFGFYYGIPNGFFFFLLVTLLIFIAMAVFFSYLILAAIVSPGAMVTILIAGTTGIELSISQLWTGAALMSGTFAFALWRYYQEPHRALKAYMITAAAICLMTWTIGTYAPSDFIVQETEKMVFGAIIPNPASAPAPAQPPQPVQTPISNNIKNKLPLIGKGVVNSNDINLRITPSTKAPIIGKLRANEQVLIRMEVDDWYLVQIENTERQGWASKQFVNLEK